MGASVLRTKSEHLHDELVLVELGRSTVVSDHPDGMGGSWRGPMPGELMKGALASGIAIAIGRDAARTHDLPIEAIAVNVTSQTAWERLGGPLPTLTYLPSFNVRIAVAGPLDQGHLDLIGGCATEAALARTLARGVEVVERNSFDLTDDRVRDARGNDEVMDKHFREPPRPGERLITEGARGAGVTAQYLGDGKALVRWARQSYVVDASAWDDPDRVGASPEELLLGSLCACTSVFAARAASMVAAPVEIRVEASGELSGPEADVAGRSLIISMAKSLEVRGSVRPDQQETIEYFADHCSLGETLRRGAEVHQELVWGGALGGLRGSASVGAAEVVVEAARSGACDDGMCCVPLA